jgi:hypothetical protein
MDFVDQYISQHPQPVKSAKEDLAQIDIEIRKIQELEAKRFNLTKVLDAFGDDSYKKKKPTPRIASEDIEENHEFDQKILEALKSEHLNMRDILTKIGVFDSNPDALRAIKKLAEKEIIKRNKDDNTFYLNQ